MRIEQNEFHEQFSYQEAILPDSVDSATAFFYAVNQLIRSTPSETSRTLASNKPGVAGRLPDRLSIHLRDTVFSVAGWMRRVGFSAASIWNR